MPPGLLGVVVATALGGARVLPVIWMVAPLGGPRLPATVRIGFALLLALVASPALVASAGIGCARGAVGPALTLLLARELVDRLCLGLVASAAFRAAEVAGRLGDTLRGANVAEILVPTAEERASPLGVLYLLLATIVFLQIGGVPRAGGGAAVELPHLARRGRPGRAGRAPRRLGGGRRIRELIASGVALAAPVVVALWLTDLALGLIARAAPSVPVYFLGLPLKGLLAIGVILLGLGALQRGAGERICGLVPAARPGGDRFSVSVFAGLQSGERASGSGR